MTTFSPSDHLAALTLAATASLVSMVAGSTELVGTTPVRRSSLFGFDVAGQTGLSLEEAARVLAQGAWQLIVETAREIVGSPRAVSADLLAPPRQQLDGRMSEMWKVGGDVAARIRALRGSVVGPYVKQTTRGMTIEITYPAGRVVPAL